MPTLHPICTTFFSVLLLFQFSTDVYSRPDDGGFSGKIVKGVRVAGLKYTQLDVVTRELVSRVGRVYQKGDADRDLALLDRLDLFSQIEVKPVYEGQDVILDIKVREILPYLPFDMDRADLAEDEPASSVDEEGRLF